MFLRPRLGQCFLLAKRHYYVKVLLDALLGERYSCPAEPSDVRQFAPLNRVSVVNKWWNSNTRINRVNPFIMAYGLPLLGADRVIQG